MLKREITYKDLEDRPITEVFYFNMSKAELIELEVEYKQGIAAMIEDIVKAKDNKRIIAIFKKIILMSYGQKSEDGKRFIKSPELSKAFSQTDAYTELFMDLATNEDSAVVFIKGILPADMGANITKENLALTPNLASPNA